MLPHDKVYTRLGISKIHGIGVIAISDIPEGTPLFAYDTTEVVWVKTSDIVDISEKLKEMYHDFCVIKNNGTLFGCPPNFNQLTMAWYMNHSDNPNVGIDENYDFKTKSFIKEGEELTINYNSFSE